MPWQQIFFVLGVALAAVFSALLYAWWLLAFVFLAWLFVATWLFWRQESFRRGQKWTTLEILVPREIKKSPRAMEQVLTAIHSLRNAPGTFDEFWLDGEVTRWFSLEIISLGGETHMYVRFFNQYRNLVEAAFFSYYPDVELAEVSEDYTDRFPANVGEMQEQGYKMFCSELMLTKEEAYPIRTYVDFESPDEEKQYDPISSYLELLNQTKPEEMLGIQILITPRDPKHWGPKWAHLVEKLKESQGGGNKKSAGSQVSTVTDFPGGPLPAFSTAKKDAKEDSSIFKSFMRTPGETDVLKAVENNLSKPAFDTMIRIVYFSPESMYFDSFGRRGLTGIFNQYAAMDLNSFKRNDKMSSGLKKWHKPHVGFAKTRNKWRQERIIYNFRHRHKPAEGFFEKVFTSYFFNWNNKSKEFGMNTECLATIFHPPTSMVLTAPHLKRVESRKAGPPMGLAIYGEEEELEKYR